MNVSNATVSRDLSLLDLPEPLQARVASGELPATVASHIARVGDDGARRDLADQYGDGRVNRAGVVGEVNRLLKPPKGKAGQPSRRAWKLGGLTISVAGPADKLTHDALLGAFGRICKELKDGGKD